MLDPPPDPGAGSDTPSLYGWDWSDTTHGDRRPNGDGDAVPLHVELVRQIGGAHVLPGKGLQGWARSLAVYDCDGYALGRVYYGGRDDVYVRSTSAAADVVRSDVTRAVYATKTARVDTRVDSLASFGELSAILEEAAASYGSLITRVESSQRGESKGRTVYLGAPSSAIRVRLYEKWLESPGQYVEGTNRVEVQLRPPSKAKERVSGWSRAETFCASRVTQALAARLGSELVDSATLHVDRGTPDLERSLQAMGKQYRRAANQWLEVSGGDLGRLLDYLAPPDALLP